MNFHKKKKIRCKANLKKTTNSQGKCMNCHQTEFLGAHHIIFRSEGGDDNMDNLITLCQNCHRFAHDGLYVGGQYVTARDFMISLLDQVNDPKYSKTLSELRSKKNGE